ncbi:helix-turn-helix domain-containing protein [Limosilactobacillus mucosae]|uniref:Helix-turn-helix domain-containing protein n=1 Tax=Limosilactobacillus mucosae TaxID=97478 RepID=A0AAJ1HU77_LIMMU|nr:MULTISPECIES: helix-turn-helix domain-containing protein [Lactobacillaceae]MDD6453897.1 helix-turn-helix domain-containing protein [Lactobacillus sp.]MDC2829446.1 helix-turn-helix domain-containing protein [Limosilactobacillus mucosae]MDC2837129.1 helix-turn-helix domain-containing protein [Limosilactobacillus mucosae]MDC2838880.1 helix-turn-helix domain-containing protein [Limosilactobacillus mucosae]MDC2842006.1 helix-turn-helix domain-containing protein [Limosilactobacillus mucosae]
MKLRGDIFKQIRRKRGLSQTALAEGICTQATISLMEKQNRIPKMNILTALCSRLDITTDEIIENDDVSMTAIFDQIGRLLAERQFEAAQDAMQKIKVKNLQNEFDKQRYYYLLGMLQVQEQQFDEAIFNFELVLTQFSTTSANIYLAMTTIGMAMAYEKIGSQSRALRLVERAMRLIDEKKLTGGQMQWIVVYEYIAGLYLTLGQPRAALNAAQRGIDICRQMRSMFLLDRYYLYAGKAQLALANQAVAKQDLEIAHSLALVNQHPELVKESVKALATA